MACPLGKKCPKCDWYIDLHGTNPNTGEQINNKMCAIVAMPILAIELRKSLDGIHAAVNSERNENVRGFQAVSDTFMAAAKAASGRRELETEDLPQLGVGKR